MLIYKANLGLLNSQYGEFERRVLQVFCDQPIVGSICLPGWHDFHVLHFLKDSLLIKTDERLYSRRGSILGKYQLTDKGRQFVEDWKKTCSFE